LKDKVFAKPIEKQFEFDEEVASVFDDMLNRSVPFYKENLNLQIDILKNFLNENDKIVDLGSSTGTFLIELAKKFDKKLNLIGIDNSSAMIKRAKHKAKAFGVNIKFIEKDFLNYDFSDSSNYCQLYNSIYKTPKKRKIN
jgi:tRNA (cmo5U34)-methyltransferase